MRLISSYLVLIVVLVLVVGLAVTRYVDGYAVRALERQLSYEARLIAELVASADLARPAPQLDATVRRLGQEADARITVIAADGTVVADSQEQAATMENHADRPEVQQALAGERATVTRYSTTLRTQMLYVAHPVTRDGQVEAVVRLALPLRTVQGLLRSLWGVIGAIMGAALLLGVLLAVRFSATLGRPLADMTEVARSMAEGNLQRRVHYQGQDEIGMLADAMNCMAASLSEKIGELAETRGRLATVLDNTVNGVLLIGNDEEILLINPAARRLLGVGDRAVEGSHHLEVTRSYGLAELVRQAAAQGKAVTRQIVLHTLGERTVEVHVVPVGDEQGVHGTLTILNDITELKRLETVRKDFVANVSHELKTPLAAISGSAETLLIEQQDRPEVVRFASIIYQEAQRLIRLTNDLLELARLESGDPGLHRAEFDLKECITAVTGRYERQLADKGLHLELELPPHPVTVHADRDRVTQVLINLLDNAIHYSPEGRSIRIMLAETPEALTVGVADQGPGIPPHELTRIFERFYRLDRARTREAGGTGLGLSIVRNIVEAHGGKAWAESEIGRGSTFWFTLPRGEGAAARGQ
jgi:two-component system phosphate regulon sensor histidine kinase PhoR